MENSAQEDPMIDVPQSWLQKLADLTKKVHAQIENLPPEDYNTLIKTDVSALLGYASSAETIISLKGIVRRDQR